MLTYPIKMMFRKIVKCMQVRACVAAGAVGPASFAKGPGGLSLPQAPRSHRAALGCAGPGPPPRAGLHRPRTGQGTARAAPCGAPTAAEDGGTAAF